MKRNYTGNEIVKWSVTITDFVILNATLFLFDCIKPGIMPAIFGVSMKLIVFLANISLFIAESNYSTIIHIRRIIFTKVIKRTFCLSCFTFALFYISTMLLNEQRNCIVLTLQLFGLFYGILILSRFIELEALKRFRIKGRNSRTALFVGNDPAILDMYNVLMEDASAGYRVLGYYADKAIANAPEAFLWLGTLKDLNKQMASSINDAIQGKPLGMNELFCSLSHDQYQEVIDIIQFCDKNVIHFYYIPRQFGEYHLHLDSQVYMGRNIYTNHFEPLTSLSNRLLKRSFDVAVSSVVCLCMLPFLPIIALIIKMQSPGPLFFKQARTGLNGKTFYCLKFRSMHVNKDADKAQATKDDPRKFAFGNFMRKTNIDEFPQFINVLKGDMSIVGPRPHMLYHTETYGKLINKYMVRHFSKPGITGWAQVTGFRGETNELWQMEERIRRDIWYIENWSPWLDIHIMFLTAKSIFWPDKNAY